MTVLLIVLALLLVQWPAPAQSSRPGARLEGLLVAVDGRPASDHTIHLIDERGDAVARAATTDEGLYTFGDVPPGEYALGIENPQGAFAPVAAAPVRLGASELVRRDVKLMVADSRQLQSVTAGDSSIRLWWVGLSRPAKVWTVIGGIIIIGITIAALDDDGDDDDQDEMGASPF